MDKYAHLISQWIKQDPLRLQVLTCLHQLHLPQGYIAAGFVRNLVWDHLHHHTIATPLNDIDVIYYDLTEINTDKYKDYEKKLSLMMPSVNWQVRNQALMHKRNGDEAYKSSLDAIRYWPEKETAVAIRFLGSGEIECISAFGFNSLFNLQLTHNPQRDKSVFEQRVQAKSWLKQWPNLTVA